VGRIREEESFTMQELIDAVWFHKNRNEPGMLMKMLREPETVIDLPKVHIKESAVKAIMTGAQVMVPAIEKIGDVKKNERVSLFAGNRFIGIGTMQIAASELQHRSRGLAIKVERMHLGHGKGVVIV
jgi:predicted RNA-binding protein (TIGR00451 family)